MGDATREGRGKQRLETLWKKFESTLQLHPCVLCILFFFSCHYSSFMEVCMFIEINASKVYFYYVGKKRKKKERQLVI